MTIASRAFGSFLASASGAIVLSIGRDFGWSSLGRVIVLLLSMTLIIPASHVVSRWALREWNDLMNWSVPNGE